MNNPQNSEEKISATLSLSLLPSLEEQEQKLAAIFKKMSSFRSPLKIPKKAKRDKVLDFKDIQTFLWSTNLSTQQLQNIAQNIPWNGRNNKINPMSDYYMDHDAVYWWPGFAEAAQKGLGPRWPELKSAFSPPVELVLQNFKKICSDAFVESGRPDMSGAKTKNDLSTLATPLLATAARMFSDKTDPSYGEFWSEMSKFYQNAVFALALGVIGTPHQRGNRRDKLKEFLDFDENRAAYPAAHRPPSLLKFAPLELLSPPCDKSFISWSVLALNSEHFVQNNDVSTAHQSGKNENAIKKLPLGMQTSLRLISHYFYPKLLAPADPTVLAASLDPSSAHIYPNMYGEDLEKNDETFKLCASLIEKHNIDLSLSTDTAQQEPSFSRQKSKKKI